MNVDKDMESSNVISSQVSIILDLPPSCIQFCPAHPKYFVVGTYNLQKDEPAEIVSVDNEDPIETTAVKTPQNRNGSLVVFKVEGDNLVQIQTLSQPSAILDLRFHPDPKRQDIFAVVSSTGTLAVFKFDPTQDPSTPLTHLSTSRCEVFGEDVLYLQCNWHTSIPNLLGVTTSTGDAVLLKLDEDYRIIGPAINLDITNSLEAWCIAFSPPSAEKPSQVTAYCGGDDSMLRYISSNWNDNDESPVETPYSPITIKGTHSAGVTAILPLPLLVEGKGRIVVTGSYDDYLRVFFISDLHDSYGLKRVELLLEENLGGGVWRLDLVQIHEQDESMTILILASCMHAGARLVELRTADKIEWSCKVLARFEEHKSMNYGSDFVRPVEGDELQCVSTSFYDRLLCLWKYEGRK